MIKFLFLLPVKILGLLFIGIGSAIKAAERRKAEQEKQAERIRREYEKQQREKQKAADRINRSIRIEKEKAERLKKQQQREKQREEKAAAADRFKKQQAEKDLYHYREQLAETLKVYNEMQREYDNSSGPKQTTVYRKIIGINQSIRNIEKQIDKAIFIIDGTG